MPLNNSGPISIGGSTTGQSINLELGRAATASSNLNEASLRSLAGVASGTISLSNFYGKGLSPYTWTVRTAPTTVYNTKDVYDSATTRLLFTSANAMYYTTNGTTWTAGTYQTTSNQSLVCTKAGDGYFYSGHIGGIILYSANGVSGWTFGSRITVTGYTYDVWYVGSQYVYAHSQGIYTSPTRTSGYTQRITGDFKGTIARNPSTGLLLSVAGQGYQPIATRWYSSSDNGTNWTLRGTLDAGVSSTSYIYGCVTWFPAGNCFVYAGGRFDATGSLTTAFVYTISSDGVTATNRFSTTGFVFNGVGVDSTNSRVIATGNSGRVYSSPDGITWTANTTGTTASLSSVTHMPNVNLNVVLGYQNTTYITGV